MRAHGGASVLVAVDFRGCRRLSLTFYHRWSTSRQRWLYLNMAIYGEHDHLW